MLEEEGVYGNDGDHDGATRVTTVVTRAGTTVDGLTAIYTYYR